MNSFGILGVSIMAIEIVAMVLVSHFVKDTETKNDLIDIVMIPVFSIAVCFIIMAII